MDLSDGDLSYLRSRNGTEVMALNLTDAIIRGATFARGPQDASWMSSEHLDSTASYKQGDLSGVTMVGIDLAGSDLSNQNLTGAAFGQCDLTNADFANAVITGVTFVHGRQPSIGLRVDQIRATWNYKHGRMVGISLPDDVAKVLAEEQLRGKP